MKHKAILSEKRDLPLLLFLWKWKVATTAALTRKFFGECLPSTAYRRLWVLQKMDFIRTRIDNRQQKFVWMLTSKGYSAIRDLLPALNEEGFRSESIGHDLLVSAIHLGEWFIEKPNQVELFTEQELRRYHFDYYPSWIPRTNHHRPDGYWHLPFQGEMGTIALEVELTQKRHVDYELIGDFYADHAGISRVLWLVPYRSLAVLIHNKILESIKDKPFIHNFVTFKEFQNHGWQSLIEFGPEKTKSIATLLGSSQENDISTSSKHVLTKLILDTHKSPHRSTTSALFAPGDFSDRLGL